MGGYVLNLDPSGEHCHDTRVKKSTIHMLILILN